MASREDPNQFHIDWTGANAPATPTAVPVASPPPDPPGKSDACVAEEQSPPAPAPLVQRLPWDFSTTFPEPTPEAIEAGVVTEEDLDPENIRSLHENHARHALFVLTELDAVLDARRRGVDPRNNKAPMLKEAKERLQQLFEAEPPRLERWWQTLMETYEQAFGPEAADAFGKAIRAWHAHIEVVAERPHASPPITTEPIPPSTEPVPFTPASNSKTLFPGQSKPHRHRISTRLPVPKPLPAAVAAGHFGQEENGKEVLHQARPQSAPSQVASEALELALKQLEGSLTASPPDDRQAPSLDGAMAFIQHHAPRD